MPLLIAAGVTAVAGLGATAYGASQAGKVTKYDQNKIRQDLAPWQQSVDKMQDMSTSLSQRSDRMYGQADQFFDPRSNYYNQQRQQMREQIAGQTANVAQQQNQLMAQRGMGGGGIKGLLGAVSANQAGEQTRQGMLTMQQQGIGLGQRQQQLAGTISGQAGQMLSSATTQQGSISENIAQAYLANVDAQNAAQQAKAAGWMGAGSGLLGAAGTMAGGYEAG